MGKILDQKIGPACFQLFRRRNSGSHGDGANMVFVGGGYVLDRIADQ